MDANQLIYWVEARSNGNLIDRCTEVYGADEMHRIYLLRDAAEDAAEACANAFQDPDSNYGYITFYAESGWIIPDHAGIIVDATGAETPMYAYAPTDQHGKLQADYSPAISLEAAKNAIQGWPHFMLRRTTPNGLLRPDYHEYNWGQGWRESVF